MASLLEEILGEKEGALPPEPVKPEKTGDFWTDLKNQYNYNDAMTRYNEQVGMASQRPFSEHMKVAEFRPASARERKLARLAKIAERSKYSSNRIAALPAESAEKAKQKILSEFKPEDWSLQVEEMAGGWPKTQIYDELTQEKISKALQKERMRDFAEAGYENASPFRTGLMGSTTWESMNKVATAPNPEFVYHQTPSKNIEEIGFLGLVPPRNSRMPNFTIGATGSVPQFPEQLDKVFFSSRKGTIEKLLPESLVPKPGENPINLRMKFDNSLKPDIHQDIKGEAWYQTKNPVPPEALEIETAPGQWEALLDYIRKGGK